MVQCEICGGNISPSEGGLIRIGTTRLKVCKLCAKYGISIDSRKEIGNLMRSSIGEKRRRQIYELMDSEIEEDEKLTEKYGMIIRKEREKRGLKIEELAKRINEKISLIRKIERGEIMPEEKVRKKLERFFNLDLEGEA